MPISPVTPSPLAQLLIPADQPLPPARRLVVLIPDQDTDEMELARRIWALTSPRQLAVLYLGLASDPLLEARARRRLTTLAALTRGEGVTVQTHLAIGSSWERAVTAIWRSGDLMICHAEQFEVNGLWRRPLAQKLVATLQAPVCLLSGFYPNVRLPPSTWMTHVLSWFIPLAILLGFFLLQVQIAEQVQGWLQTALLSASVALEFGLVGFFQSKDV